MNRLYIHSRLLANCASVLAFCIALIGCGRSSVAPSPAFEKELQRMDSLLRSSQFEAAATLGQKLISQTSDPEQQYALHSQMGTAHIYLGDYDSTVLHYFEALQSARVLEQESLIGAAYINLGVVCNQIGYLNKAEDYLKMARSSLDLVSDSAILLKYYHTSGNLFFLKKDLPAALKYYERAAALALATGNTNQIIRAYNNLGALHQELQELSMASFYYRKCLDEYDQAEDKTNMAVILTNLGTIEMLKEDYGAAELYFQRAFQIYREVGFSTFELDTYLYLANSYLARKQYADADRTIDEAISLALDHNLVYELEDLYRTRISLDSIASDEARLSSSQLAYQRILNERLKTESANKLKMAETISTVNEKERDNILLQEKLKTARLQNAVYILLFLLASAGAVFIYRTLRERARMKEEQILGLSREIEAMKTQLLIRASADKNLAAPALWTKARIEEILNAKINDSDWKIILAIQENPLLNNAQLAEKVSLSVAGVRSSLQKLYRFAGLESGSENKRLKLIHLLLSKLE